MNIITLGIGTPSGITPLILFGLSATGPIAAATIPLTLAPRSTALTLAPRSISLTLPALPTRG